MQPSPLPVLKVFIALDGSVSITVGPPSYTTMTPHHLTSALVTSALLSVPVDLPLLGISCKWNPLIL